jgi:hypothetical protein
MKADSGAQAWRWNAVSAWLMSGHRDSNAVSPFRSTVKDRVEWFSLIENHVRVLRFGVSEW